MGMSCALLFSGLLWSLWPLAPREIVRPAHRVYAQEAADTDEPATHTVQRGETLSEIAKAYGVSMDELMQLNGIEDPNAIDSGRILRLPLDSTLRNQDPGGNEGLAPVLPAPSHTVKRGETLSEIAKQYGLRLADLMALNDIDDPDAIYGGQTLRLPTTAFSAPRQNATPAPPTTAPTATDAPAAPATAPPDPAVGAADPGERVNDDGADDVRDAHEPPSESEPQDRSATLNQTYTVEAGDTLNRIALRHGVDVEALRALNRLDTRAASALRVGQTLLLPATVHDVLARETTTARPQYTVQPGDSLSVIADQHDVSLAQLMTVNGITNSDAIRIGERLTIPPPQPPDQNGGDAPASVGPAPSGFHYYTVGPGDTLSELAADWNCAFRTGPPPFRNADRVRRHRAHNFWSA